MNKIEIYLKKILVGFHKLVSIEKLGDRHLVSYIQLTFKDDKSPNLIQRNEFLDLRAQLRESVIEQVLDDTSKNDTSLDEDILTPSEVERVNELRKKVTMSGKVTLLSARLEWANQFKIGDRVYYKGLHGVITFKHQMKEGTVAQEWSVTCNDTEYRYVSGLSLRKREVRGLSNDYLTKRDKELEKLSTERLLKMYRRSMKVNRGVGDLSIKRILNKRENLNKTKKIINVR